MNSRGQIDRRKHEVDIAERVLEGGVWTGPALAGRLHAARTVELRKWPLGSVFSTVRVRILPPDRDER